MSASYLRERVAKESAARNRANIRRIFGGAACRRFPGVPYNEYAVKHVPGRIFPWTKPRTICPSAIFHQRISRTCPRFCDSPSDDMHNATIQQRDYWLQTHLLSYVTWARNNNSLLTVTFDEDDGSANNHIPTPFVGPMVKPGKSRTSITTTCCERLRTFTSFLI